MSPQNNVSPRIYKFSYENLRILKDTMDNYSGLRYTSNKLYQKFQELKEELKEAVSKCPYAPCVGLLRGGEAL